MPYIKRDSNGAIQSITQVADDQHHEYMAATSAELVAFLTQEGTADLSKSVLAESDRDIARITEDLIYLLISKNSILFTELPEAVQQKLLSREKLRSNMQGVMSNFLDDEETL